MQNALRDFFESKNIEYYAVLSYADCIEINAGIAKRAGFTPQSVIMYLLPYYTGECDNISRYAASLDYHILLDEINSSLISVIRSHLPDSKAVGYGDHSPIAERHGALIGGLGVAGENGLLINEKYGSYVFIGEIVSDIEPDILGAISPMEIKRCSGCGLCKDACPTGILSGRGEDCLSAITQRKGELSDDEKRLMLGYNTVWGCDICQTSCPHNLNPAMTPIDFFYRERISSLTEEILCNMSDVEFKRRAFSWRGRAVVQRNLNIFAEESKQ